ncbi:hypothetical protein AAFN47_12345 [Hoeflea sp. CAU 1731]
MNKPVEMQAGGYAYVPGVFQYSAGVSALPGFRIDRVRFDKVAPMKEGFALIAEFLKSGNRPLTAFCACEMRSPEPFTEKSFGTFNRDYSKTLIEWGIMTGEDNPVARSNVCPEIDPPSEPGFHAFCYTVPDDTPSPTFTIAGSGEAPEGKGNYQDHIVRRGEVDADGLREKAHWVMGEMERRMSHFDAGWKDTTAAQLYTVYDIHPFFEELVNRGAVRNGLTWHYNRPPVVELDYEMDCRRIRHERVIPSGL